MITTIWHFIFIILLLQLFNAYFNGIETALISLNPFFVEIKTINDKKSSILKTILNKPELILTTCLMGTNITLIASTQALTNLLSENSIFSAIFLYFIYPITTCILCEIYPKLIASRFPYTISKATSFLFAFIEIIFYPIVLIFQLVVYLIQILFFRTISTSENTETAEIKSILSSSLRSQFSEYKLFIEEALHFDTIEIEKIQKPISSFPSIVLKKDEKIDIKVVKENYDTLYIVYENYELLGICYLDYILKKRNNLNEIYYLTKDDIFMPPLIYEGKNLINALELMNIKNVSYLLTIDTFGDISGIISKKDIFSTLTSAISSSDNMNHYYIKKLNNKTYVVSGITEIDFINKMLNLNIYDDYYHTFNGFIIHNIGRIPKEGEILNIDGLNIRIISCDERKVDKAMITLN
jgi:putative hemolysin